MYTYVRGLIKSVQWYRSRRELVLQPGLAGQSAMAVVPSERLLVKRGGDSPGTYDHEFILIQDSTS